MSSLFIGLFTVLLVLDCLVLGLLVLMQLPKKDAGVGMAFGGGATDALFGAGSGNVLTKLTKYTAAFFFALVLILSILKGHSKTPAGSGLQDALTKEATSPQNDIKPAITPATSNTGVPLSIGTNTPTVTTPLTNTPPTTNTPAGPAK